MVRVSIFGVQKCGKCLKVKGRVDNLLRRFSLDKHVEMVFWDQDTVDGRAEGAWHDVYDTLPVTVIEKEDRNIARWEGDVPKSDEIKLCLEAAATAAAAAV